MFSVLSGFSGIEQSDTVQGNLLASSVGSPLSISPTAMSSPIMSSFNEQIPIIKILS